MDSLIRKETIGEELGVSLATVNNWIKTRVIPAPDMRDYYSQKAFEAIINKVKNDSIRLASRANRSLQEKKQICYLGITDKKRKKLLDNLVNDFEASGLTIHDGILALVFAILYSNNIIDKKWQPNSRSKTDALLSDWMKNSDQERIKNFYSGYDVPNFDDDIIGAFYQSIQNISQRSNTGSYYTPSELLKDITVEPTKIVLDPCCGSGGLLLNILTKKHNPKKIFARDIDELALKICFINLVLFFNDRNISPHISKHDITLNNPGELFSQGEAGQFDFIVTNPPWGSKYTRQQKDFLFSAYPELETSEVFSISLYNALKMLKKNGELFFFLPHSFLNVAAHKNIRNFIFREDNKIDIKLLGNAFRGVVSEGILLHIKKSKKQEHIHIQSKEGEAYQIPLKNIIPPDYIVSATGNAYEASLIEKIYNASHTTLQKGAIFGLGIVTGNNKKHLLSEKTRNSEAIFRGKDMEKYRFLPPEYFIEFQSELYQQVAPVEYYRRKKMAYRFINNSLVFVLDNNKSLLLNSANFIISENYPMETITAFFNSDIYTFIFRKKFHSKKILKSHLQILPLPVFSPDTHQYIYALYSRFIEGANKNIDEFQAEIDEIICKAFSIGKRQYNYIKGEI
jgi:type I restriction-modification system DNA methylase subunit